MAEQMIGGIAQGAGIKFTDFRSRAFRRFFCYVRFFKLFKFTHIKRLMVSSNETPSGMEKHILGYFLTTLLFN
jgi:hypothetical protein